ncbi:Sphingolipid delta(4)-desaturase DES1 [Zancudomyces culisetae]|uniref:Sphingolipid delta(4)-desaturase DES1 n=1 Tax=Zancudomyces culisetae TaxID=1213189 RepID=A0A1R1PY83_ZANCU|nr:Sphingolipid delta(4)-desaturase DES1 [Zancudomyces culisetae]|eukprot:OMH85916.1 Sphingolipid delta(4)-desaturase DES1 [Zancudomyces culisetae]
MTKTLFEFDPRFPLFNGEWKKSVPAKEEAFAKTEYDEPHIKRKLAILKKYPEIQELMGYDIKTLYVTLGSVSAQVALAYYFGRVFTGSTLVFLLTAYFVGGTLSTLYGVIFHEVCHNLAARTSLQNRWIGMIANIPMLVPIAQSFRRYHLEHHTYQGVKGHDPDLPLDWEVKYVGNSKIKKFFWLAIYGIMYIGRGLAMQKQMTRWEKYNVLWTIFCDIVLYYTVGPIGIVYLVCSILMGYGPHPGAAHFIQEHYTFVDGQETYGYYGSGNLLYLNIGYHNEHHDFHNVPWTRLPIIKEVASEFYDSLAYHDSWCAVLYMFVMCKIIAPQSRAARTIEDHTHARNFLKVKDTTNLDIPLKKGVNISKSAADGLELEYLTRSNSP